MAITTDLEDDIGKVRAELGDDVEDSGVLPSDRNLTDEHITYALAEEDGSVMKAVARLAALIARRWATACNTTAGPLKQEFQQIYDHWQQQATILQATHGSSSVGGAFSVAGTRDDAYSDGVASEYSPRRYRPC